MVRIIRENNKKVVKERKSEPWPQEFLMLQVLGSALSREVMQSNGSHGQKGHEGKKGWAKVFADLKTEWDSAEAPGGSRYYETIPCNNPLVPDHA